MSGITHDDLDCFASSLSDMLYACTKNTVKDVQRANKLDSRRQERLMDEDGDTRMWRAINWMGDYNVADHIDNTRPSDEKLKDHFEEILNPPCIISGDEHNYRGQYPCLG